MREDSDRVFDVSKPHRVGPDPTSRPIIVGHHPVMSDPMMRNDSVPAPTPTPPSEHKAIPVHTADENDVSPTLAPAVAPLHPESVSAVAAGPEIPANSPPTIPEAPTPPTPASSGDMHLTSLDDLIGHEHKLPHSGSALSHQTDNHEVHPATMAHQPHRSRSKMPKVVLILLLLLVAGYLAIDSKLIKTSVNLPFHVFSQPAPVVTTPVQTKTSTTSSASTLPAGFTAYKFTGTTLSFDYPTVWGAPAIVADPGYSSRSATAKSDGTYAYLVNFATNKDVQIAVTSAKYLPASRTALYYDYLQWCVGTNDAKFYKSMMHFTTTAKVDTPTTTTCDQGPMADATKLNSFTIVQLKTTNPDGTALGDLYTENLKEADLPVLRVKDAKSTNGDNIKKLLATLKSSATTTSPTSTNSAP